MFNATDPLWSWWISCLSRAWMIQGANVVLRLFILIVAGGILTSTTSPMEITWALRRLLKPLGLIIKREVIKMTTVKKAIITAVCAALAVVLPVAFHAVPNAGSIFLPMHIPVLLAGLICGWGFGLLCGLVAPLLSNLFTGMPPMAYLPSMLIELAVYGAATGLIMSLVRTRKIYADLYISLVGGMLIGRIVAGITRALIFAAGGYSMAAWTTSYFVTSLPGIIIQLVLLPSIVFALESARLIPLRYPQKVFRRKRAAAGPTCL